MGYFTTFRLLPDPTHISIPPTINRYHHQYSSRPLYIHARTISKKPNLAPLHISAAQNQQNTTPTPIKTHKNLTKPDPFSHSNGSKGLRLCLSYSIHDFVQKHSTKTSFATTLIDPIGKKHEKWATSQFQTSQKTLTPTTAALPHANSIPPT